jgi:hypothetical protein
MPRSRRWLRLSTATLCLLALLTPLGGCTPSNEPAVQLLGEALRRQLPAPPLGQACPGVFDEEVLMTFLRTGLALQNEEAHHQLRRMAWHLECVSAARFAEIATAMEAVLEASQVTSDEVQEALAPLVMLFADMAGPFRGPFALWLLERSTWLHERLEGGGVLSALGLPVSSGSTIELRSGLAAFDVLRAVGAPGMLTGNCRVEELLPLADPLLPGTPEQLFCPNDCNDVAQLGREIGEIQEALFPEMEEICQQIQQERRDFSNALVQDFGRCIDGFVSEPSGLMACVADSAIARRATALDIDTNPQRDFQMRRACALTNPGPVTRPSDPARAAEFDAAYGRFRGHVDVMTTSARGIDYLERVVLPPIMEKRHGLELQLKEAAPGWTEYADDPSKCPACEDPDVQDAMELLEEVMAEEEQAREQLRQRRNVHANANRGAHEAWREMEELSEDGGSNDCGPDGHGCSDQCGIQDQLMAEMNGCIEAEAGSEAPMLGVSGGDPINPWAMTPNPMDPRSPDSVAAGFAACLRGEATLLGGGLVTQHHCSTTLRCANGEMPRGIDCDCLDEQNEQRLPENCDQEAMYCTDGMSCDCGGPLPPEFEGLDPLPGDDPDPVPGY